MPESVRYKRKFRQGASNRYQRGRQQGCRSPIEQGPSGSRIIGCCVQQNQSKGWRTDRMAYFRGRSWKVGRKWIPMRFSNSQHALSLSLSSPSCIAKKMTPFDHSGCSPANFKSTLCHGNLPNAYICFTNRAAHTHTHTRDMEESRVRDC